MSNKTGIYEERINTAGLPGHVENIALVYVAYHNGREIYRSPLREQAESVFKRISEDQQRVGLDTEAVVANRIAAEATWKAEKAAIQAARKK